MENTERKGKGWFAVVCRLAWHGVVGWLAANVIFLFITPETWMSLEYVRQIALLPLAAVMAVCAVLSWVLENRLGKERYRIERTILLLTASYLLAAAVLGILHMLGSEGVI